MFNDLDSLKQAIQKEIDRPDSNRITEEISELYQTFAPFQDGQAYRRTGQIIKTLQETLAQGCTRDKAIQKARVKFKEYLYVPN